MAMERTDEKQNGAEHVEQAHEKQVQHDEKYYAMRIDGDDEDHMHEPPVSMLDSATGINLTSR